MVAKIFSIPQLLEKKANGHKITMLTAYDYPTAYLAAESGVDLILVGDSLGMTILGYSTPVPVTLTEMIHHTKAVVRGAGNVFVVADMPYGSCQMGTERALADAIALIKEGGARAVKIEGGEEIIPIVKELTLRGIPVVAHIGVLPQTAHLWEGYTAQGLDENDARELAVVAQDLEEAGAFAIVLECIAQEAAKLITEKLDIITIGIGSGSSCDGQLLVSEDMLGLSIGDKQKFNRKFTDLQAAIRQAFAQYIKEVREGTFPTSAHAFEMEEDEAQKIY